jgi:hypothetical protein
MYRERCYLRTNINKKCRWVREETNTFPSNETITNTQWQELVGMRNFLYEYLGNSDMLKTCIKNETDLFCII